jgi:large subunit ribosomal protein L21
MMRGSRLERQERWSRGATVYAIFEDGGKQYKVSTGDKVLLERRDLQEGQTELTLDKVLMVGEGAESRVGTPWVEGATISAKIVQELKLLKVTGVKFRRRKGSMVRWGHRQKALKVEISAINA